MARRRRPATRAEAESLASGLRCPGAAPLTATKAVLGHLLGAGGAVELVAALRALERGLVPPTANVAEIDPAFEIDLVRGAAARTAASMRHALMRTPSRSAAPTPC